MSAATTHPVSNRPTLARLVHLAGALREGRVVTCVTMARELEVTTKTVQRDLEFLRDRLHYDFEWDSHAWTYRLLKAPVPVL